MGETENPVNSGVSEPTEGEQEEDTEGEETPVIDEENNSDENQEQTPDVEEDPIETPEEENPAEEKPEESSADSATQSNEPMAAEVLETGITVNYYGDLKSDDNKLSDKPLEVIWLEGANAEGDKVLKGRTLKFILNVQDMENGWRIDDFTVSYAIKGANGEADTTGSAQKVSDADNYATPTYTIPTNVPQAGDTPASYSGEVTIDIVLKSVETTLYLSDESLAGKKVYLVDVEGNVDTTKEIKAETPEAQGLKLDYATATKELKLAVEGLEGDTKYQYIRVTDLDSYSRDVQADKEKKDKYSIFTFTPDEIIPDDDSTLYITVLGNDSPKLLWPGIGDHAEDEWTLSKVENLPAATTEKTYITVGTVTGEDSTWDGFVNAEGKDYSVDEDSLTGKILAFKALPGDSYKFRSDDKDSQVKATLIGKNWNADIGWNETETTNIRTISAKYVETEGQIAAHYEIDLGDAVKESDFANYQNLDLKVWADVELDDKKDGVHTVTFDGDDGVKAIYKEDADYSSYDELNGSYVGKDDSLTFVIEPKHGYSMKKGEEDDTEESPVVYASYNKTYELNLTDTAKADTTKYPGNNGKITVKVPVSDEEWIVEENWAWENSAFSRTINFVDDSYADDAWKNKVTADDVKEPAAVSYTIEDVEVDIMTYIESRQKGGEVTISSELPYEVTGDKEVSKIAAGKYEFTGKAKLVEITIDAEEKPVVMHGEFIDDPEYPVDVEKGTAEGKWIARVPVSTMCDDGEKSWDCICIYDGANRGNIAIIYDGTEYDGSVRVNGKWIETERFYDDEYLMDSVGITGLKIGEEVNLAFEEDGSFKIIGIYIRDMYDEPDDGVSQKLTRTGNVVSIPAFTMERGLSVDVVTEGTFHADVQLNGKTPDKDEDGVYVVPQGEISQTNPLTITLMQGESSETIRYAKVYDGEKIAETTAAVSGADATITKIDEKDTGTLRVDLAYGMSPVRVVASVKIRQEPRATEFKVLDGTKAVTKVTMPTDSAVDYSVTAVDPTDDKKSGNLRLAEDKIRVAVVSDAAATLPDEPVPAETAPLTAKYNNGELTITAKPAKTKVEAPWYVKLYSKDAKDKAVSIEVTISDPTIIGVKPSVKEAVGSKDALKVELSTGDKVKKPLTNNVYYEVTWDYTGKDANGNDVTSNKKTKYFQKTAYGKNDKQEEVIPITADNKSPSGLYKVDVKLVQTTEGPLADNVTTLPSTVIDGGQIATLAKLGLRGDVYETKLSMKPANVTIYTGQRAENITKAQFKKETGYTTTTSVQFVDTKTGVALSEEGSDTTYEIYGDADEGNYGGYHAEIDTDGNVILECTLNQWDNLPTTLGLKVTAAAPAASYAATAVVKITTVRGIHTIGFAGSEWRSLYLEKTTGKTNLKLTPVLNDGYKQSAPKSKNLTYALAVLSYDDEHGEENSEYYQAQYQKLAKYVTVNQKNGTVTVDNAVTSILDGEHPENNRIMVLAKAADYPGSKVCAKVYIDLTQKPMAMEDKAVIVKAEKNDESDRTKYVRVAGDNGILYAEDFLCAKEDWSGEWVESLEDANLFVRALKEGVDPNKNIYSEEDFAENVTYASAKKNLLAVDNYGHLEFVKGQKTTDKGFKLTLKAADGSKKNEASMTISVRPYKKLGFRISDTDSTNDPGQNAITFDGPQGTEFTLETMVLANGKWWPSAEVGYSDVVVKAVKGAKIVEKTKDASYHTLVLTDNKATVTITDKVDSKNTSIANEYIITQEPPFDTKTKAKAPSIKQVGKLTTQDIEEALRIDRYGEEAKYKKVTFQVTNKASNTAGLENRENHNREYVLVTPDYTKTKAVNGRRECDRAADYFLENGKKSIRQIDDNGKFDLNLNVNDAWKSYDVHPGSYSLNATIGYFNESGKFVQTRKSVTIKVAIPGKAKKTTLTLKGNYTIDPSTMAPVELGAGHITTDYDWELKNTAVKGNYAMNKIDRNGQPNQFRDYFQVTESDGKYYLSLRSDLTADQIAIVQSGFKDHKADLEGYVTVTNYKSWENEFSEEEREELNTKDLNIKVTIKGSSLVAKTKGTAVYANGDKTVVTVSIFRDKKSTDAIGLAGAWIAKDAKESGAKLENDNTTGIGSDPEALKISIPKVEAGRTYPIELKVITADSAYATGDVKEVIEGTTKTLTKAEVAKKYGCTVKFNVKVVAKATATKNKIDVTKKYAFTSEDFLGNNFEATAEETGKDSYEVVLDADSAIEGMNIKGVTIDPAFTTGTKATDATGIISVAYNNGKLSIQVDRKKLITSEGEKNAKIKFKKNVDFPVVFNFDAENVTETVKIKLTMPNPMTYDKAKEAVKDPKGKKRDLEKRINEMRADSMYARSTDEAKGDLRERIITMIRTEIPKDAQVTMELEELKETGWGENRGYKTRLILKGNATSTYDLKLGMNEVRKSDVDSIASAIKSIEELKNLEKRANRYTESDLLADVRSVLDRQFDMASTISLTVTRFDLHKATTAESGWLEANITVKDRISGDKAIAEVWGSISALENLRDTAELVKNALQDWNKSTGEGIKYAEVIAGAANTEIEDKLEVAIKNAAKEAIRNPQITVAGFEKIEAGNEGDHPAKDKTGEERKVDIDFKKCSLTEEKGWTKGWVAFNILLEQEGRIKKYPINLTGDDKVEFMATLNDRLDAYAAIAKLKLPEAGMPGIDAAGTVYDAEHKTFTITLDKALEDKTDAEMEALYKAWKNAQYSEEKREKAIREIERTLSGEWDALESVVVTGGVTSGVAGFNKDGVKGEIDLSDRGVTKKTITKNEYSENESIGAFAERVYDKLDTNQDEYIRKVKDKFDQKYPGVRNKLTFGSIGDIKGEITVTINYEGGDQEEFTYEVNVNGIYKPSEAK